MASVTLKGINSGCVDPRLNAIFVHGLGDDPVKAWCRSGGENDGYFWPRWLAEDIEGLAVYSLGYPADKASWGSGWPIAEAAVTVLDRLMADRTLRASGNTPIVFVCHSLGGLIVKKLVLISDRDRGQEDRKGKFLDRIAGVVFLATPHGGSTIATIASQLQWFVSDSTRDLKANDAALLDLNVSYRHYIGDNPNRIRHRVFYEKERTWGAKVVPPISAEPGLLGARPVGVDRPHRTICKPEDRDDEVYISVVAFLENDILLPRPPTRDEKLDELLEIARQGGAFMRAEQEGISEHAVRKIVIRLGGEGIAKADLLSWLDNWIEAAQRELGRRTNEDEAFEAARREAERRFKAGVDHASSALMDEFAREERVEREWQEERKRRRIRILEEAVRFDELALEGCAAAQKLRQMAEVEGISGSDALGEWLSNKAAEFCKHGYEKGENAALLVAIAVYREALQEYTRERNALDWAAAQMNLGNALATLGKRESGAGKLEEAVVAYREALKELTREHYPLDWAGMQNNLGTALLMLGERESGRGKLKAAIGAYRGALKEYTRKRDPLGWAMTQNNLGTALAALGVRESGTRKLKEAVAAYREALKEYTRERDPFHWAMTQNNLAHDLFRLGERESGKAKLKEAVAASREALKEYTREHYPLHWAMTQTNLGHALFRLGEHESWTGKLEEAVVAYREALKERTRERCPLDWAVTQSAVGNVLLALGERDGGTGKLEEAVVAYREALKELTRKGDPLGWAMTQNNIGRALAALGKRESGTDKLEEAVVAYREALKELTRTRSADLVAVHENMACAVKLLNGRRTL